ncbi:MAG: serine/threonine-protein phosphatase [Armatimonadetes bacterium]|nr:serine/threonine-protein phosphatase [Armatimonadota bacterium]
MTDFSSSRPAIALTAGGMLATAWADHLTGYFLDLSVFYALLIVAVGWNAGIGAAFAAVVTAVTVHLGADAVTYLRQGSGGVQLLNELFHLGLWGLAGVFAATERKRADLIREQRDRLENLQRTVHHHLTAAQVVQSSFLSQEPPTDPRIDLAVRNRMAMEVGGDFIDLRKSGSRLTLCVGDVSGKGPAAALVAALIRGALQTSQDRFTKPAEILSFVNQCVWPLPGDYFATCFYGIYDMETGVLSYASAGHEPALLRCCRTGALRELGQTGPPVGIESKLDLKEEEVAMHAGDFLAVFTDGVTDPRLGGGDAETRLWEAMRALDAPDAASAAAFLFSLCPEIETGSQPDDVVLVMLRIPHLNPSPVPPSLRAYPVEAGSLSDGTPSIVE